MSVNEKNYLSTSPNFIDIIPLITPLKPHSQSIFDKSTDKTKTPYCRKNVLGVPQHLKITNQTNGLKFYTFSRLNISLPDQQYPLLGQEISVDFGSIEKKTWQKS